MNMNKALEKVLHNNGLPAVIEKMLEMAEEFAEAGLKNLVNETLTEAEKLAGGIGKNIAPQISYICQLTSPAIMLTTRELNKELQFSFSNLTEAQRNWIQEKIQSALKRPVRRGKDPSIFISTLDDEKRYASIFRHISYLYYEKAC
jgi:hypothetical protein